jgi:glycosyltransferase involved in cell wall biosynthesis
MKKVLLRGPVLTRSGYGEQARFALRALRSREDVFDIYINPIQWGGTSWLSDITEERTWIDQIIEKTIHYTQHSGKFDYSVQVTIPNEFEKLADVNVGYTAGIETTRVSHEWIHEANQMDRVIVVSTHSRDVFEDTTYDAHYEQTGEQFTLRTTSPIAAVNYPVKEYEDMKPLALDLTTEKNFVCVAQMGPRKNLDNTVAWFVEEFFNDEDVGLIVKTNYAKNSLVDKEVCHGRLLNILSTYPDRKCKVYLLHGDMTDKEMHEIYLHPKVVAAVSFTHGEGFGLPLFEAAYMGIPVVATGWSGQLDFLCDKSRKEYFYNVSFDIQPIPDNVVWDGVLIKDSMWAYPRKESAQKQMRACLNDIKDNQGIDAQEYAKQLRERFSEESLYKDFINAMGITEDDFDVENWLDNLGLEEIE